MHNILDVFKFLPDWTTDNRANCPWASKKYPHWPPFNGENGVSTFSRCFTYLRTIQNILMTLLAGSQVSDRYPLGYCHWWGYIVWNWAIWSTFRLWYVFIAFKRTNWIELDVCVCVGGVREGGGGGLWQAYLIFHMTVSFLIWKIQLSISVLFQMVLNSYFKIIFTICQLHCIYTAIQLRVVFSHLTMLTFNNFTLLFKNFCWISF